MLNVIRVSKSIGIAALAVIGVALFAGSNSTLKAASTDERAVVTFDRPVEVPGIVLPPGTYVFKTAEHRELVQIFNGAETKLFATVMVVSEDRPAQSANADCFVQLAKSSTDAPQGVEGLFFPGQSSGLQFLYPASQTRNRSN